MSWSYEGWLAMLRRTDPKPQPRIYYLRLYDDRGDVVSGREFEWKFDGIGTDDPGKLSSDEEYSAARKMREMYRDAAYAAGKWPRPNVTTTPA